MPNTVDVTVIIPIHSVRHEKTTEFFNTALESIQSNTIKPAKVMIVRCGCGDVINFINTLDLKKYNFDIDVVENHTGKAFQNQMNYAVSQVTTKYFSLLEFDDEYSVNWFKNVETYINKHPEIDMFLPIISDVDENNKFLMLSNEAAWAINFSDEIGMIDNETLMNYPNINIDGLVATKESYLKSGGLKSSIRLSFNYEFLLRYTRNGYKIMVIPKIGYKHTNMRTDSLFWNYKHNDAERISPEEAKFWMELAQKEYYYTEDRNVVYAPVQNAVITNG